MSDTTAMAMFLDTHPYHGGISTNYLLYVTENSEPSILLFRRPAYTPKPRFEWLATWTPTVENMLEDLLLLIGVEALRDSALRAELLHCVAADKLSKLRLYDIAEESRRKFYSVLLETKLKTDLVLTLLHGCTPLSQVDRLPQYTLAYELCISPRADVGQISGLR